MTQSIENKFRNYAQNQKEELEKMGMSVDEFVKNALEWSNSVEGKLELDKFILSEEIKDIEEEISVLKKKIDKKQKAIDEIDEEISNL